MGIVCSNEIQFHHVRNGAVHLLFSLERGFWQSEPPTTSPFECVWPRARLSWFWRMTARSTCGSTVVALVDREDVFRATPTRDLPLVLSAPLESCQTVSTRW